ncbi:MAG: ISAzo13 family transposase [Flavobacteriaceae bacterium]|jgi:hypothetical protein|nr:ISAzo13 family transposase [Flavobacteriaceae bacterium]
MEYETAGDPMSDLKWTRKTTTKISKELESVGVYVSKSTVGKILKKLNFSLKSNSKKISNGGKSVKQKDQKKRDLQFRYITRMIRFFIKNNMPPLSGDTKKKELIGNFKNPGTRFKKTADLTNDHDFLSYALGKAALYGVYNVAKNDAFVSIGMFVKKGATMTSGDTPEFAVESIQRWLLHVGLQEYPNLQRILVLVDAGGSNGYRCHQWKVKLQQLICDKYGIKVTVCHYPPGASKWNPIEHRLFSEITKNWQGTPLRNFETVLKYTRTTKTNTGLKVNAMLVEKQYEKGIKASVQEINSLNIRYHKINSAWNYTISPNV